jgi:hypothetical protein
MRAATTKGLMLPRTGPGRSRLAARASFAAIVVVALGGCGSVRVGVKATSSSSATTSSTVGAPTTSSPTTTASSVAPTTTSAVTTTTVAPTTVAPTTVPATTVPPTTVPPTTVAPTTAAPTTTVANVPAGWVIAAQSFDASLFPPFDEGNWTGVPSPALPAGPGQPLADGIYAADVATPWTADNPGVLAITVQRLELCTTLPADVCADLGSPFQPDDLGADAAHPYPLTLSLDGSIGVGFTGFECEPIDETGNGADLAALFSAFDAAYATAIRPAVLRGEAQEVIARLTKKPAAGFSGSDKTCGSTVASGLTFQAGNAPPVLLQSVDYEYDSSGEFNLHDPLTPTTAIHLDAIQVSNGIITAYFYAGFYS